VRIAGEEYGRLSHQKRAFQKSFEQSAAFLRILDAANPLDNSSVHPESYRVVEAMAADQACAVPDLIREPELRRKINKQKYISETAGAFTIDDIVKELEKPGRDPRTPATEFSFDERIRTMEDLKEGMTVPGIITNITNFGVFVDIGVKQDGLIHISQLSDTFVSDPNQVVKLQQQVSVTVTAVDVARKRISLSMKTQDQTAASHQKIKTLPAKPATAKMPPPVQKSFESSLDELKKKFRR
jgi:protein Tex